MTAENCLFKVALAFRLMRVEFRKMDGNDIEYAIRVTNSENWYLTEYDLSFYLDPGNGIGLMAIQDGSRVGLATAAIYGETAWIGNVVIEAEKRQSGIGRLLVEQLLSELKKLGVVSTFLYAYDRSRSLYVRLGFTFDRVLWEVKVDKPTIETSARFERGLTDSIDEFDRLFFRRSRMSVLRHVAGREGCIVISSTDDRKHLNGYLICSPAGSEYGSEIAPLIAGRDNAAKMLSSLGDAPTPYHLYMPEENITVLKELGLKHELVRRIHRGFLGEGGNAPILDEHILSAGFLESG